MLCTFILAFKTQSSQNGVKNTRFSAFGRQNSTSCQILITFLCPPFLACNLALQLLATLSGMISCFAHLALTIACNALHLDIRQRIQKPLVVSFLTGCPYGQIECASLGAWGGGVLSFSTYRFVDAVFNIWCSRMMLRKGVHIIMVLVPLRCQLGSKKSHPERFGMRDMCHDDGEYASFLTVYFVTGMKVRSMF